MTTLLLIRHGHTDAVGRLLAGRSPAVHLSDPGRREVAEMIGSVRDAGIGAVYCSPLERARETAQPLADALGLKIRVRDDLIEIDYGRWTGREIGSMAEDPVWARYQRLRSSTRIPGGELFVDVQARVVKALEDLHAAHPQQTVAVVSHGDVIRVALAHYLGMHIDLLQRIRIDTASVSALLLDGYTPQVIFMNRTGLLNAKV